MEWDIPDDNVKVESMVLEPIAVSKFLDTLSETDRKILTMRMDDVTLEKIAEELGFKTHSAIQKNSGEYSPELWYAIGGSNPGHPD